MLSGTWIPPGPVRRTKKLTDCAPVGIGRSWLPVRPCAPLGRSTAAFWGIVACRLIRRLPGVAGAVLVVTVTWRRPPPAATASTLMVGRGPHATGTTVLVGVAVLS